jgi:GTPase SAR1 family protein
LSTINIGRVLGRKILILGDVGSGKTRLTAQILDSLLEKTSVDDITVIDMSPTTITGIGGRLSSYTPNALKVRYLVPKVVRAPRIEGKNRDEVISLAEFNKKVIEPLLHEFISRPTTILFINDLSIYLHAGDVEMVIKCLELSNTIVANSYYGQSLLDDKGSGVSSRERKCLEELAYRFDNVLRLE